MSRERDGYREQLERVQERFPKQEMIPVKDAAEWLGIDARRLYTAKALLLLGGILIVYGSVGAMETGCVGIGQAMIQSGIGLALMYISLLTKRTRKGS